MVKIYDLINSLTNEQKHLLEPISFDRGNILYYCGAKCNEIVIVLHGEISMFNIDKDGNEMIFNTFISPTIFGNNLIFSSSNQYLSDIYALSKGDGFIIKRDHLLTLMQENRDFLVIYLQLIADKTINVTQKLKIISIQNAKKRLLAYLDFLSSGGNKIKIKSVTKLAKEICLTRETTSRLLASLMDEGKLTLNNNVITLNENVLETL